MIKAIVFFVVLYVVFRVLTAFVIPFFTKRSIRRYKDRFVKDNPDIFREKNNGRDA